MPPSTPIIINKSCKITSFDRLRRWSTDDHAAAFQAFRRSANAASFQQANFAASFAGQPEDWMHATEVACSTVSEAAPRKFFEEHFLPCQIIDTQRPEGLFTGYYEPELQGSREFSDAYPAPVLRKPSDLVAFTHQEQQQTGLAYGRRTTTGAVAFEDRRAIEQGSLANQGLEICWLSSWVDAFFLHVQGSGRVTLQRHYWGKDYEYRRRKVENSISWKCMGLLGIFDASTPGTRIAKALTIGEFGLGEKLIGSPSATLQEIEIRLPHQRVRKPLIRKPPR